MPGLGIILLGGWNCPVDVDLCIEPDSGRGAKSDLDGGVSIREFWSGTTLCFISVGTAVLCWGLYCSYTLPITSLLISSRRYCRLRLVISGSLTGDLVFWGLGSSIGLSFGGIMYYFGFFIYTHINNYSILSNSCNPYTLSHRPSQVRE